MIEMKQLVVNPKGLPVKSVYHEFGTQVIVPEGYEWKPLGLDLLGSPTGEALEVGLVYRPSEIALRFVPKESLTRAMQTRRQDTQRIDTPDGTTWYGSPEIINDPKF